MMHNNRIKLLKQKKRFDIWIVIIPILLSLFGILMIYEASNVSAFKDFGDKYHYVKEQLLSFAIGIVVLVSISILPYRKYYTLSVPLMFFCIISLIAVFIPGIGIKAYGASRWISLKFINFQPSELTKLVLVLYLSSWLSSKERGRFIAFLVLVMVIVGLIIIQPDLGTAIVLTTILLTIYFLSEAPLWHFFILIPMFTGISIILAIISPYRFQRLTTFLNPNFDPLGSSYHIRQILISLGSGGLFGLGLGSSIQKYQFLPEATTDSIFAIIGEEFGFVGGFILISIYLIFLYKIYKITRNAPDKLSFLLSGGLMAYFGFQTIVNLGSMVTLFPLTGVPLPFISYGGSNLIISLIGVGVIINISKYAINKDR